MKLSWEASDIRGGRIVGHPGRAERWLITRRLVHNTTTLYSLASLADGELTNTATAAELAEKLTRNEDWPAEMLPILADLDDRT